MKPATVKEIIEVLKTLPPDFPCYFRPKYFGDVSYCDDVPVNAEGIVEMHPDNKIYPDMHKNVTFLC
jgi:hypothetical protein